MTAGGNVSEGVLTAFTCETHLGWKFPMTIQKAVEMHPRIIIQSPPALHFLESVKSTEVVRLPD